MRKEAIQMADNGLEMSDYEIKTMYLNAKNKGKQAKILADLNACSVDKIKTALRRAGVDQHQLPRISKNMKKEAENMEDGYIKITSMIAEEASENEKIKEFQKVKEENLQETDKIEKANHKLLLENASLKEQLENAKDEIDSLNALISDIKQCAVDDESNEVDPIYEKYNELERAYNIIHEQYSNLSDEYVKLQQQEPSEAAQLKIDIQDRDDYIQLLKDTIVDMVVKSR